MPMYGGFEGFPLNSALFRLVIHHDPCWENAEKMSRFAGANLCRDPTMPGVGLAFSMLVKQNRESLPPNVRNIPRWWSQHQPDAWVPR